MTHLDNRISRKLKGFLFLTLLMSTFSPEITAQEKAPRPNIILILTDDQGYADVGFNNSPDILSPNIDRIAKNGVNFPQGYVTHPVCGPSRAAIITGRHQERFGSSRNPLLAPNDINQGLPLTEQTLGDALREAGYTNSIIGKWHLGAHPELYPLQRGFDEFFGFLAGGHQFFPELWTIRDITEVKAQWDGYRTRIMRNNGRVNETEYLTDAFNREAIDFISRQADHEPFFLFLSYNAPHTPLQATEKYLSRFSHIEDEDRRTYAAMISAVDDGVGEILDLLEERNMTENTLIFFLSDNGGPTEDNASDNTPLRAGKGHLYEGGIRVPFALQWLGTVPAGLTFEHPISSMDIFATAVELAGVTPKNELDGVNLIPFLTGEKEGKPHDSLFWRTTMRNWYAIIHDDMKWHFWGSDDETELYNLASDISEEVDLSDQEIHIASSLSAKSERWQEELVPPAYLGLLQGNEYNRRYPDRFIMRSPYEPDTLEPVIPDGYELIWFDEFNEAGSPNSKYWTFENGFVRNEELQWYQEDNAKIVDNRLLFEGRREQFKNPNYDAESNSWRTRREFVNYSSSSIHTRDKFTFQYGIMEVRARIDTSKGSWPAIWTLGKERSWPDRGEIDIMEFYRVNDEPMLLANAAWGSGRRHQPTWDGARVPLSEFIWYMPDFSERYHIWRMEWDEDEIKLYLNNRLMNTIDVERATYEDGFNPFRQPHYILLNLALGSNGGDPTDTDFPILYEVDYVRVFQKID